MPLAEHDELILLGIFCLTVSIHVPLAEHDLPLSAGSLFTALVSIHVPLAEHDQ